MPCSWSLSHNSQGIVHHASFLWLSSDTEAQENFASKCRILLSIWFPRTLDQFTVFPASKPLGIFKLNLLLWAREMTQVLVELDAHENGLGSVSGIHVVLTTICKPRFRGYFLLFFLPLWSRGMHMLHIYACILNTHTHKINKL